MNIDIFSSCVFAHGAFEHLAHQINTDIHIAVFDVGLYINDYHNRISDKKYDFVIILNTRKYPLFIYRVKLFCYPNSLH